LVHDNLSTHTECIRALGKVEGARLWARFRLHSTPKHRSWLNIAETEISLWSRECLGQRRIGLLSTLKRDTRASNRRSNRLRRRIVWSFNVPAARQKFQLDRRYAFNDGLVRELNASGTTDTPLPIRSSHDFSWFRNSPLQRHSSNPTIETHCRPLQFASTQRGDDSCVEAVHFACGRVEVDLRVDGRKAHVTSVFVC
jgi:hypothetical protein